MIRQVPHIRNLSNLVLKSQVQRNQSSFIKSIHSAIDSLPQREAALYRTKNLKWTAGHIKNLAIAHANALLDIGVEPGDRIALWLPDKAEKHIAALAAVTAGLVVVDVDSSAITTVDDLRQYLKLANSKVIYFDKTYDHVNGLKLLRKAIPEFFEYDDRFGQAFHSKHFPELKYFVHTDFDIEMGCLNYKSLFVQEALLGDNVAEVLPTLSDETVGYVKAVKGAKNWELTQPVTHKSLLENNAWYFAKNIANKVYYEAEAAPSS